jgi:hypothetical protein
VVRNLLKNSSLLISILLLAPSPSSRFPSEFKVATRERQARQPPQMKPSGLGKFIRIPVVTEGPKRGQDSNHGMPNCETNCIDSCITTKQPASNRLRPCHGQQMLRLSVKHFSRIPWGTPDWGQCISKVIWYLSSLEMGNRTCGVPAGSCYPEIRRSPTRPPTISSFKQVVSPRFPLFWLVRTMRPPQFLNNRFCHAPAIRAGVQTKVLRRSPLGSIHRIVASK